MQGLVRFGRLGAAACVPLNPIAALFASGSQGVWFDATDLSTIYTDTSGTTPAGMPGLGSAVPVGKWLDKSGRGNHFTAKDNATGRPTLSARLNFLLYTEQLSNANWQKLASGTGATPLVTDNYASAPDGTTTAARVQMSLGATLASAVSRLYQNGADPNSGKRTKNIWLKTNDGSTTTIYFQGPDTSNSLFTVTPNWQLFTTVDATATGGAQSQCQFGLSGALSTSNSADLLVWHPDVRRSIDAIPGIPSYQRVVAANTYDTAGFPLFVEFNGSNQSGSTASIDFTATDKMSVFAGVTKYSDAAAGYIAELSATIASNNGTFLLSAPNSAAANLNFSSKGTTQVDNTITTYAAPTSRIITGLGDISAPSNIIRVNGAQVASVATTQGTGTYGNFPLYVAARNNTSSFFNGRIGQFVVVGKAANSGEISAAEGFINSKIGGVY